MMAFVLKKPVPTVLPQTIFKVSYPSSMLSRSLQRSSPQAISTVLSRPACCLAPSQQGSPQAISTVSSPSSTLSRSLPAKLSASYFHGFLSIQHAVSLPPSDALRNLFARFPLRPARCLAPAQRSSPQAICTVSSPSSMLSRFLPAKLSATYLHGFLSVQHAVSLPPSEALLNLFPRFPLRPGCCLAPSQQSFPQTICTVFSPSSMLSRSLPAKLSASCLAPSQLSKLFPRFPIRPACYLAPSQRNSPQAIFTLSSVQHAVSLPPSEALRNLFARFLLRPTCCLAPSQRTFPKLFPRFSLRPACCLAPSQWSSPQAIFTVSSPSSMLSRSLPAKLSASYLDGFLSVQHAISLPPSEALRNYFHGFPSVQLSRSLPAKLPASYLHGFLSVQHAVSSSRASSQQSSPQAISTVFVSVQHAVLLPPSEVSSSYFHGIIPSSMLSRSLQAQLSASYLHAFFSVQHAVSLPPTEVSPSYFHGFVPSSMLSRFLPAQLSVQHAVSLPSSAVSPSYFPRFCPVQHAVSLPPRAVSRSYFHGFVPSSIRSRSLPAKFPQAIFHGFVPSSMLSRSLPAKFPQAISTASSRPASSLAPSQRSFPKLFPRLHPVEHPVSLPPSEVSPSYFHGFIPSSIWSRSLPAKLPQAISTASSRRASGLAPLGWI